MGRPKEDKAALFGYYWRLLYHDKLQPIKEYKFLKKRRFRFDWAFPNFKVAVEVDGGNRMVKKSPKTGKYVAVGRHTQESDYRKLNFAAEHGWLVFRFTPAMLKKDPTTCCEQVMNALTMELFE